MKFFGLLQEKVEVQGDVIFRWMDASEQV